jgi:hypothetical protein
MNLKIIKINENKNVSAPSYCGLHTVPPQGWNYPGQDPAPAQQVDLGAHPPYHPPPEGFKVIVHA